MMIRTKWDSVPLNQIFANQWDKVGQHWNEGWPRIAVSGKAY